MDHLDSIPKGIDPQKFLETVGPERVGAALTKLFAASIGDVVVVMSRSPAHKHYSFADIEWMVMPPVAAGQFYIVEATDKERGFRAPVAFVTWALVSQEVDKRIRETAGQRIKLRPDEWKSGDIGWLIDAGGGGRAVDVALKWLKSGPFEEQELNLVVRDAQGEVALSTLNALSIEKA